MQIIVFVIFLLLIGSGAIGSEAFLKGLGILTILLVIAMYRIENASNNSNENEEGDDEDERH